MNASITINVTQQVVFWLLLFVLLAWMILFAWLALRPDREKKQAELEEAVVRTGPLTTSVTSVQPMMTARPVHEPVSVGTAQRENAV